MRRLGAARSSVAGVFALAMALAAAPVTLALGSDLAAGITPAVNSTCCGLAPVNITDGDDGTSWASNGGGLVTLDLGAAHAASDYRVITANCTTDIESSTDGTTWSSRVSAIATGTHSGSFLETTARYWRLVASSCSNVYQVWTWSLFAAPAPTPTPTPTPTATPTPTPAPTATPTPPALCASTCTLILSDSDRARLDSIHGDGQLTGWAVAFGTFVVGGLLGGILITTGLRR